MLNNPLQPGPRCTSNRLLSFLPSTDLEQLWPQLELVKLPTKSVLLAMDTAVGSAYFVEAGVVSMIAVMADGAQVEVGLVGPEGMIGLSLLLGASTSPLEGLVQVGGTALRLPATVFRAASAEMPSFLKLLLRYVDTFFFQVAQTAACNGRHRIEQRLARWLLMMHDRVEGDGFPMTQEFMSAMLGVRRAGVTVAIAALQRANLVQHHKGNARVLDRPGLEAASCECYDAIQRRSDWLTGQP